MSGSSRLPAFERPKSDRPQTPPRPKLAASLVLIAAGDAPRVLMGRRADAHRFMPGKFVFPGGRVEASDADAPTDAPLPDPGHALMAAKIGARRARAAPAAAIREAFEETGVRLSRPGDVAAAPGPWRPFADAGEVAATGATRLLMRAITPTFMPMRFDTWFFIAALDAPLACQTSRELEDVDWYPLADLADLDTHPVTRFVVDEARKHLAAPTSHRPAFLRTVRDRVWVDPL